MLQVLGSKLNGHGVTALPVGLLFYEGYISPKKLNLVFFH